MYSLVYCDKCDLAYHWKCLNYIALPQNIEEEIVICNRCIYTPKKIKTIVRKGGDVQVLHPEVLYYYLINLFFIGRRK